MNLINKDIVIIGSGMVGMSLAQRLISKNPRLKILIVEKEEIIGKHSSGRNSGVLHAGIYYVPNSLKAKVCIKGAKLLKEWCEDEKVPVLKCGKVIAPQDISLDPQLDLLIKRGRSNGAEVQMIDQKQFNLLVPDGSTKSGRAIWSPNTSITDPKKVLQKLKLNLEKQGVEFLFNSLLINVELSNKKLEIRSNLSHNNLQTEKTFINYGYLFNTAGLQSDKVAEKFGIGLKFKILPFKGVYWELDNNAPFKFKTNLYPVPDLNVPFLGVHITPSIDGKVYLGPTAIPAFGRENYSGFEKIEPLNTLNFFGDIASQFLKNKDGFRKYTREQAFHGLKPFFVKSAKKLVPRLESHHLKSCKKVGIRPQLYDKQCGKLIQDFLIENGKDETHVLNSISPAFTASFALADLILQKSNFSI